MQSEGYVVVVIVAADMVNELLVVLVIFGKIKKSRRENGTWLVVVNSSVQNRRIDTARKIKPAR